ncbi:hypothetical protein BDN72DRAFT_865907 [Pluteus cervinus]|uniref:Uncharacterized protein n=1 Tax=Pluteus cervinus TaxID=181527 RepID=A0ACD3A0P8_9AGAR|nr:hypothetical protein BDN72DRAFT_865907 [Pluteus cervinus]
MRRTTNVKTTSVFRGWSMIPMFRNVAIPTTTTIISIRDICSGDGSGDVRLRNVRSGAVRLGDGRTIGRQTYDWEKYDYDWQAYVRETCVWETYNWETDVQLGDIRLGNLQLGDIRLGNLQLGNPRLGEVRLGDGRTIGRRTYDWETDDWETYIWETYDWETDIRLQLGDRRTTTIGRQTYSLIKIPRILNPETGFSLSMHTVAYIQFFQFPGRKMEVVEQKGDVLAFRF